MSQIEAILHPDDETEENTKYHCDNPETIRVVVSRGEGIYPAAVEARLVDISQRGTKLVLESNLSQGEAITLSLQTAEFEMAAPAVVRWCQLSRGGRWYVGCEFTPTLQPTGLTKLAEAGYLERRRTPRRDANVFTTACWELGEMPHAVVVKNMSPGGFCIVSPWPVNENGLLTISPENEDIQITGQVCWQRKLARGYLVGCYFTNDKDFFILRKLVSRLQDEGVGGAVGSVYQQIGTAAVEEHELGKAKQYFQLALEVQFSHLGDALNTAIMVCTLARVWTPDDGTNLAGAVAQTLGIDLATAERMLVAAFEKEKMGMANIR